MATTAETGRHRRRYERYAGGDPEAERREFEDLARDMMRVQARNRRAAGGGIARALHAKAPVGVENARLRFHDDLPAALRAGFAQPGAEYPATVRLSNASGIRQPDRVHDLHGIAVRVRVSPEESHDLLASSHPVSHARDAREFVAFAKAMAGARNPVTKAFGLLVKLPLAVGWGTARRMRGNVRAVTRRVVGSLATETYWSRGALLWGNAGPVRYLLRPAPGTPAAAAPDRTDPDFLHREFARRIAAADVAFELCVQRYVDERRTPVEDASVEWKDAVAPALPVGRLTLPAQDLGSAEALAAARRIEELSFNPWYTTDEFRPLGNLNRARKAAYQASSAHRLGMRFTDDEPLRNRLLAPVATAVFGLLNRFVPWHRLPPRLSLLNLILLRKVLRRHNLHDGGPRDEGPPTAQTVPAPVPERLRTERSYDGQYNDLSDPAMGAAGAVFGRNLTPVLRPGLFDVPNPVTVSRRLLHRETFLPATSLNVLAAAWIQFQVHDWVDHPRYKAGERSVEVPLPPGTGPWRNTPGGPPESVMRIAENRAVDRPGGGCPVFRNTVSHWWDGSELYGSDKYTARSLREPGGGAGLRLEDDFLPAGPHGIPHTGFHDSWWMGLSALHTLFAREHNAVCGALRAAYPAMTEERIHQTARLVVSALIAKIHTLEWTPAVLGTEAVRIAMRTNWEGPPRTWPTQLGLWLFENRARTGIPGTLPHHHGVPFSLTEEYITVYRMHPLLPDDFELYDHDSGQRRETVGFTEIQSDRAEKRIRETGLANTLYSFGVAHPGAVTLHNHPRALQHFERDGEIIDLSVVDLVRARRRAIPRYNDFRAGLHKPRLRSFEELSPHPETVDRLKEVYRSVDEVDTMVGLFAENPPRGFGFSDTAFRVFVLMASRRLQSDRFLTVDYRPEVYTPLGLDWVREGGMTSVVLRHCPELAGLLPRHTSAFAPWRTVARTGTGDTT
ncbi:hypothetical protein GCM10010145_59290 [Streptomyces ruber]|uniref:Peroxidase n=2 Tax=Streptomyces TaxID=1883 RepID=A0A918BN32_9ACTN|nr:peroxidase family protein [Streptomyces ruber]GGQ81688.1 hypothetical protein GCM10010145_59290 [Streptomyces ruber]